MFSNTSWNAPLFAAGATEAKELLDSVTCSLCGARNVPGFRLFGDEFVAECDRCRLEFPCSTFFRSDLTCPKCGAATPPKFDQPADHPDFAHVLTCFECIEAGRAGFSHCTELGDVRLSTLQNGRLETTVSADPDEEDLDAVKARLASQSDYPLEFHPGEYEYEAIVWVFAATSVIVLLLAALLLHSVSRRRRGAVRHVG